MEMRHGFVVLCVVLAGPVMASAYQFRVGDSGRWSVPDPNAISYNKWAEKNRFQIGDTLLFVYPSGKDSVLQVDSDAYTTCNTSSYLQKFQDGNTVVTLEHSGPFYFISGVQSNCLKNERLIVLVLADRSGRFALPPSSPPPPPPPSPAAEVPAPSTESTPPPPPPPNGAHSVAGFFGGVLGASFMASLLVL